MANSQEFLVMSVSKMILKNYIHGDVYIFPGVCELTHLSLVQDDADHAAESLVSIF